MYLVRQWFGLADHHCVASSLLSRGPHTCSNKFKLSFKKKKTHLNEWEKVEILWGRFFGVTLRKWSLWINMWVVNKLSIKLKNRIKYKTVTYRQFVTSNRKVWQNELLYRPKWNPGKIIKLFNYIDPNGRTVTLGCVYKNLAWVLFFIFYLSVTHVNFLSTCFGNYFVT